MRGAGQVVGYSLVAPIECLREFLAGVAGVAGAGAGGGGGGGGVRMIPAAAEAAVELVARY